jgi:hypothetical protein
VVLKGALNPVLGNQIYEEDFLGFSYGFRPGRSPHQALDALSYALLKKKVNYVLDADIQGFFEVEKLAEAQRKFSAELPPVEALRAWMLIFIDYIAAKKIIAPALNAMAGGPSRVFQQTNRLMEEAANALASRAVASRDLRPDVDPMDMLRAIYGVSSAGSTDDWPEKARQFVRP